MSGRVALVTGGNRGIGFEVCKNLCKKFKESNGTVILTARDEDSGLDACKRLSEDGLKSCFMRLDVTSKASIENAVEKIEKDFKGLDILINNAGIMYSASKSKDIPYAEQVEKTLETNFFGLLNVFDSMFPLLRPHARVVNVTSGLGSFDLFGQEIKQKLRDKSLDRDGLLSLVRSYIKAVKNDTHKESGWPDQDPDSWMPAGNVKGQVGVGIIVDYSRDDTIVNAYSVSKLAVTILTHILAKERGSSNLLINCCCPGWVKTRLGGANATKTAESGAADIVECALLPNGGPNGRYFKDRHLQPLYFSSQSPMVCLKKVEGFDGKCNDVVFCGEDAMQHLIFFPGDVQNYFEEMDRNKENRAWKDWDLESTAQILSKRFPKCFVWVIRTSFYDRDTFACYSNFIEMDACGTPDFEREDSNALLHLKCLLDSAVRRDCTIHKQPIILRHCGTATATKYPKFYGARGKTEIHNQPLDVLHLEPEEEDVTADFPIVLIGFSKGCMVLNQITYEFKKISTSADHDDLQDFASRLDAMYWLDSGNGGHANAYVTDEDVLFQIAHNVPKVRVHVTPYQIKDESRPWIEKEEKQFVSQLKSLGIDIKEKVHFVDKKPSLSNHFRILTDFKAPPST